MTKNNKVTSIFEKAKGLFASNRKLIRIVLVMTYVGSVTVSAFVGTSQKTLAAACANTANYGTAVWTVNIPATGQYNVWVRTYAPSGSTGQLQLELDGATCWQVGGGQSLNSWVWVNWYGGNQNQKLTTTIASTGSHSVKVIGLQQNVQVDKIILLGVDEKCADNTVVPTGNGDNCATAPAVSTTPGTGTTGGSTSPSNPVTSGQTTPAIVAQNTGNIAETTYIVDGKVLQTSKGAAPLDTSKLSNGAHDVQTVVTLKNGEKLTQGEVISVNNKPNIFKILGITLVVLAIFSFGGFLVWFFIGRYRTNRLYGQRHENIQSQHVEASDAYQAIIIQPDSKEIR